MRQTKKTQLGIVVRRICEERGITLTQAAHEIGLQDPAGLHRIMRSGGSIRNGIRRVALSKWIERWSKHVPAPLLGLAQLKEHEHGNL